MSPTCPSRPAGRAARPPDPPRRASARTGLLLAALAAACNEPSQGPAPVTVSVRPHPEVATLLEVSWSPAVPATVAHERGRVEGEGSATIFGYPSDTDVPFRVEVEGADPVEAVGRTGPMPAGAPELTVAQPGPFGHDWMLVGWFEVPAESTGTYILDADGRVVWYWLPDWGLTPTAHYVDGQIVAVHTTYDDIARAEIAVHDLAGNRTETPLPYLHHDLIPLPGGGVAAVVGEVREVDGEPIVGDRIVEIVDGVETEIWNAFDALPVEEHWAWSLSAYTDGTDWTHVNGLDYDPVEDVYYLSAFYLRFVARIERTTGATTWMLGGDYGTLSLSNDLGPRGQHSPKWSDGELLMFDNAYGDADGSRLVRYRVDAEAATARKTWELRHPDGVFSLVLGDVDPRPDGGLLTSWGSTPHILAYDEDDAPTFHATLPEGYVVAQVAGFDL